MTYLPQGSGFALSLCPGVENSPFQKNSLGLCPGRMVRLGIDLYITLSDFCSACENKYHVMKTLSIWLKA